MNIREVLAQMGFGEQVNVTAFPCEEDAAEYDVWKIEEDGTAYVLKKASMREASVYDTFLKNAAYGVPRFYKSLGDCGEPYILMEYIEGSDLRKCDRKSLTAVLDALIELQKLYWEKRELDSAGFGFQESLPGRQKRGAYLQDAELVQAYETYLQLYSNVPRTLCHDDLLPFNVLIAKGKATIIDWEYAGILPYPTSLARLIAHGEEDEAAFFHMKQEDKDHAVEYYFEHLLKNKGIGYDEYRRTLDYFLLFEYCEWIMLGNQYDNTGSERFQKYYAKAKDHVQRLA